MTADEVQAKVDVASSVGGDEVVLPPGRFLWNKTVWGKSNVLLRAAVPGLTTIYSNASDYRLFATSLQGTTSDAYRNVWVDGINFESHYGSAVVINNTRNAQVRRCEASFVDTTVIKQAIFFQYCKKVEASKNNVHDYTGNGISVTGCEDFRIYDNDLDGGPLSDDAIDVDFDFLGTSSIPSRNGRVTGNRIKSIQKGNAIRAENSFGVSIDHNQVKDILTVGGVVGGILANTSASNAGGDIDISFNRLENCTSGGILADGAGLSDVTIAYNHIKNSGAVGGTNPRAGILLGSPGVECTNNLVDGTLNSGLDGGAILAYKYDNHRIESNTLKNSYVGLRYWRGNGTYTYSLSGDSGNKFSGNTYDVIRT